MSTTSLFRAPAVNPRESLSFGLFQVFWGDELRIADGGFEFDIRIPWYRSLPLSSVQHIGVSVDGQKVDRADIAFELYGERLTLDELPSIFATWWFILDAATLHVSYDGPLQAGETHEIGLELAFKIPYMMIGPQPFVQHNSVKKPLLVADGEAA